MTRISRNLAISGGNVTGFTSKKRGYRQLIGILHKVRRAPGESPFW